MKNSATWRRLIGSISICWLTVVPAPAAEVFHVFVALADNANQSIAPVPAKIGDGDKPAENLYWGCSEGVKSWFSASKRWKRIATPKSPMPEILERVIFKHVEKDAWLVADAWRGKEIRPCLESFAKACAGLSAEEVKVDGAAFQAGGASSLVAYIGHNGLMDFSITWPAKSAKDVKPKPAIVLCCLSHDYFSKSLKQVGAEPVLMTNQLMYPGAFVLHDALEARLSGKAGEDLRSIAARAYARNQRISLKAALGVFSTE